MCDCANRCFLVRPVLPARYEMVVGLENHTPSCSMTPIAALTSSRREPEGLYSLMREIRGVEGKPCTKDCRAKERGCSRKGATMEAVSSSDRGRVVDAGASAVEEAGREEPMVGSDGEEVAGKEAVAGGKKEVMGAEGSN